MSHLVRTDTLGGALTIPRAVLATERSARAAWSALAEPEDPRVRDLIAEFGPIEGLLAGLSGRDSKHRIFIERAARTDLGEATAFAMRHGIHLLIPGDPEWPEGVDDLTVPPVCLWVKGDPDLSSLARRSVAIVGARMSTPYGNQVAASMAAGVVERGYAVVSGAAFGIDKSAHLGALSCGGRTVAVLAGGVDRAYPTAHAGLIAEIAETGSVMAECAPGWAPTRPRFLLRNRLIATMTAGTIVVEAGAQSVDAVDAFVSFDPALLEVLDPEQNNTFVDHYLEVEYDLSNVMFITTANSYNMPGPLLDRMEIIPLAGYTEDEKREIARQHLLPKQIAANGLKKGEFAISDDALTHVIRYYTREAGVRNLEREIAKLARKAVTDILKKKAKTVAIDPAKAEEYLGVQRHRYGLAEKEDQVGVVTGLAWTSVGGDLLQIEALKLPGKGRMKTTGKLGDVMKESIDAAASYVRSISPQIGVKPPKFEAIDIHVHVPDGATPKDGPSAGLAMVTSIVSVLTGIPVRKDIAMTGEVSLRGNAMAIGGLKEKLLAALRGGIKTVFIPEENAKDLVEIPANVKEGLTIIPVAHVREVLAQALIRQPDPIDWDEAAEEAAAAARKSEGEAPSQVAH